MSSAGVLLDQLGVVNLPVGFGLQTLNAEVHLSGMLGLLSLSLLISVSLAIGILCRRSFLHGVLLVVSCPIWLFLAISIGLLVAGWLETSIQAAPWSGSRMIRWQFVLAAIGAFGVAFADRLLARLLAATPVSQPEYGAVFDLYNILLVWPQKIPDEIGLSCYVPQDQQLRGSEQLPGATGGGPSQIDFWSIPFNRYTNGVRCIVLLGFAGVLLVSRYGWLQASTDSVPSNQVTLPPRLAIWRPEPESERSHVDHAQWTAEWKGMSIVARVGSGPATNSGVFEPQLDRWHFEESKLIEPSQSSSWNMLQSDYSGIVDSNIVVFNSAVEEGGAPLSITKLLDPAGLSRYSVAAGAGAQSQPSAWLISVQCESGRKLSTDESQQLSKLVEGFRRGVQEWLRSNVPSTPQKTEQPASAFSGKEGDGDRRPIPHA